MIGDIISNKKIYPVVTECFIRVRELNTSQVFTEHYPLVNLDSKKARNATNYY